jgi:hypothetical protein
MMQDNEVEQALRKSHCSRKGEEHKCVGSCKITPKGIELSCPICGDDKQSNSPRFMSDPKILNRAKQICRVIGLDFDNMNERVQQQITEEIFKDYCPGCFTMYMHVSGSYHNCSCGYTYSDYKGWTKSI